MPWCSEGTFDMYSMIPRACVYTINPTSTPTRGVLLWGQRKEPQRKRLSDKSIGNPSGCVKWEIYTQEGMRSCERCSKNNKSRTFTAGNLQMKHLKYTKWGLSWCGLWKNSNWKKFKGRLTHHWGSSSDRRWSGHEVWWIAVDVLKETNAGCLVLTEWSCQLKFQVKRVTIESGWKNCVRCSLRQKSKSACAFNIWNNSHNKSVEAAVRTQVRKHVATSETVEMPNNRMLKGSVRKRCSISWGQNTRSNWSVSWRRSAERSWNWPSASEVSI